MKNEDYRNAKKQTKFGKLIKGTSYENYAVDNVFIQDDKKFIGHKTPYARFNFAFQYKGLTFGVWYDYNNGLIFVSKDFDPNTPFMFACSLKDHSENTMLLLQAKKYNCWKTFIKNFELGNVRFESQKVKNLTTDLLKIMLT